MTWLRWVYAFRARIHTLVQPRRADDDLRDELAFHLAMQTRANTEHGMSGPEAERRARMALGGVEQAKERSRDVRFFLRSAPRRLAFSPGAGNADRMVRTI
ncbi:MAG TPA: permease prefix domain 1-containing protein [Vicinamibacterales bacterium]|jgi:hypothetical protein